MTDIPSAPPPMDPIGALPEPFAGFARRLIEQVPVSEELLRDVPVLGGWLAMHLLGDGVTLDAAAIDSLLRGSRRGLLAELDLPPQRWVVRVLRKLCPKTLSDPGPAALRALLGTPSPRPAKLLRHLSYLGVAVVRLLERPALLDMAHFDLLAEPAGDGDDRLVTDLAIIRAARAEYLAPHVPRQFRSRAQVRAFRDALEHFRQELWDPRGFEACFEPPTGRITLDGPVPVVVTPIETPAEMSDHGLREDLCIPYLGGYPVLAALGGGALYSLDWSESDRPRRGTAWIVLDTEGRWRLREVRRTGNQSPPTWLVRRLWAWLDELGGRDSEATEEPEGLQLSLPFPMTSSPWDLFSADEGVARLDLVDGTS